MKSLIALMQVILEESGIRCGTSTTHDRKTAMRRIEHEGLSFLTITLSSFGLDLQKSLDQGFVGHDQFSGFARTGGLPRFLGGFLGLVFDTKSGRLLDAPSIDAIRAVRQLTLMWAKVALPCTPRRQKDAVNRYVENEKDVRLNDASLSASNAADFTRVGRLLWAQLFSRVDNRLYREAVTPKHGPGATADRLRGNSKFGQQTWTRRLEEVFNHWDYLVPSERFLEELAGVTILEPEAELPVRVVLVPKTLKTPRIIAIEPTCMQYMQQGVLEVIKDEVEADDFASFLISWESQVPNQELALKGSSDGSLATLDLSDASDRVSNQHVRLLVANHRELRNSLDATRSRKAVIPSEDGVIHLAKYASMGSALCFPMEALVFMTVIFVGIEQVLNRRLTRFDVKSLQGQVRVYGDDIIVPVQYVQAVTEALATFGLRVNANKSYWTGRFRESCGKDYFAGHDVSIVRVRRVMPKSRLDVPELVSTVELRNHLFASGYVATATYLDELIGRIIPFPFVEETSVLLGRRGSHWSSSPGRFDDRLHRPLVKGVQVVAEIPVSKLDGSGALLKWFLKRGDEPFADRNHLVRSGRPVSARIKTRWAAPY